MASMRQKHPQKVVTKLFPSLPWEDILPCLAAIGVHTTIQDLMKPTAASAQNLWWQILENFTGVDLEMLQGPQNAILGTMQYQEIYTDTMSLLMLFNRCRYLMDCCKISGFTYIDLTRPDPRNTKELLSGLINFAKFREGLADVTDGLAAEANECFERAEMLQKRLDRIDADIKDIEARNLEDEPKVVEQNKLNRQLREELAQLNLEYHQMKEAYEAMRPQKVALSEDLDLIHRQLTQLQQQTRDARARLVRSPERIKRHISDMSSHVAAERQQYASLVAKNRDLTQRLEVYSSLESDLRSLIDLEKDSEEQRKSVEETKRNVAKLKSAVESAKIEGESLRDRIKQLDRQIKNAEDRLARQLDMLEQTRAEARAKIQALKDEYLERSKDRQAQGKLKDRLVAEQREVEAERRAFLQQSEEELDALMQQYWALRKEAEDYMKTLSVQLGLEAYGFYM